MTIKSLSKNNTKKVTFSMPIEIVDKLDAFCKDRKIFKSKLISTLLNQFIEDNQNKK